MASPKLCFVGCPHLSLEQLKDWTDKIEAELQKNGRKKVVIPTVLTAAPGVLEAFEKTDYASRLKVTGVITSYICPLMYMNNPLCKTIPVIRTMKNCMGIKEKSSVSLICQSYSPLEKTVWLK